MRTYLVALLLVATQGLASPSVHEGHIRHGTVAAVSQRPNVVAGYVGAWVYATAMTAPGQAPAELYFLYSSEDRPLPNEGQVCEFQYHLGTVSGVVGKETGRKENVKIVDSFHCNGSSPHISH
jgi:hypothetical protein